jgi:hypothetical protein
MTIGRRYYTILSIAICMFLCASHYEPWPEKSWKPHGGWGNRYRTKREAEERAQEDRELARARKNAKEHEEAARQVRNGGTKQKRDRAALPRKDNGGRGSGGRGGGRNVAFCKPSPADKYFGEAEEIKPTQRWR